VQQDLEQWRSDRSQHRVNVCQPHHSTRFIYLCVLRHVWPENVYHTMHLQQVR